LSVSDREFKEAIESFKVVDTCLKCFYEGESHMYRPLSAQLRLLLCDSNRSKDNSLVTRIFNNIRLSPIKSIDYQVQGTFNKSEDWANSIHAVSSNPSVNLKLALMPFEITCFANGLEIADLIVNKNAEPIPVSSWLEQCISLYPVPITIRSLIKIVADRGGGAHVHHKEDNLLDSLSKYGPAKIGIDALFTIAIARIAQQLGWVIVQFYEKYGTKGNLEDISKNFDNTHPCVVGAAKISQELYQQKQSKFNLTSVGNI